MVVEDLWRSGLTPCVPLALSLGCRFASYRRGCLLLTVGASIQSHGTLVETRAVWIRASASTNRKAATTDEKC